MRLGPRQTICAAVIVVVSLTRAMAPLTKNSKLLTVALGGLVAIMLVWSAPRDVLALAWSMVATLLACLVITRWWKVSVHATVAGGAVATIVLLYGPWYLLLVPALVLVCWSRVVVEDHTAAQVLVGAVLGPVVGGVVFLALR